MLRYFLDIQVKSFYTSQWHRMTAASKPRTDAIKIAQRCGFKSRSFFWLESESSLFLKSHPYFPNRLLRWQTSLFSFFTSQSVILVQMPFLWRNMHEVLRNLRRKNKLLVLVHDIDFLRGAVNAKDDLDTLNFANVVICHTPQMAECLRKLGIVRPCVCLEFFDYLSDYVNGNVSINMTNPNILFAGNLEKSTFLCHLRGVTHLDNMHFSLYGRGGRDMNSPMIEYLGCFDSDEIASVVGDWGLVWDGDSIDSCVGIMGEYLQYNAPYKFSLYLALGIPVVVWKRSAMAFYVEKYHLGICVESLNDIYERIRSLSKDEISQIQEGVAKFSYQVKTGTMLKTALQKAIASIH